MTAFSRRQLTSVLISAFFWTALVLVFFFVPLRTAVEEPVYREIRIQLAPLDDVPVLETESVPLPAEPEPVVEIIADVSPAVVDFVAVEEVVAAEIPAPAPVPASPAAPAPKAEPAPVQKTEPVPAAPKKTEPAPAAKTPEPAPEPVKQTLVKSVDQLMAEQNASKGTKKSVADVDWDALFGDSSSSTSSVSTGEKTFAAQTGPAISGSAAASASDTGMQASASSGKTMDSTASASTASALSDIAGSKGTGVAGTGTGSSGSVSGISGGTGSSSAADSSGLEWGAGAGRRLIRPATTEITFSAEQKALITASVRDIRISFTVAKDGTVQRNSIAIDKKASLPATISQEIERQISEWYFEQGTADGQAVFVYSIIKE